MKIHLFFFLLFCFSLSQAQTDSLIRINGRVYDPDSKNPDLTMYMVVNLRTQHGIFGKADGTFSVDIQKKDTIIIAVTGYQFIKYFVPETSSDKTIDRTFALKKKEVILPEVRIIAPRDMDAIQRDIQKLGYRKEDYELSGINIFESPVTFLYQEFSRFERMKRHNAQVVNEEKRRNLLRELLSRYVSDSIIKLNDHDFDQFVDFCNVSEEFMKTSTQYDFMVYLKKRYDVFEEMRDYYRPDYFRQKRVKGY